MSACQLAHNVVTEAEAMFSYAESVVPKLEAEVAELRLKLLNADGGYAVRFNQVCSGLTYSFL